jgi:type IV fimbrial biogenesis protein FimT
MIVVVVIIGLFAAMAVPGVSQRLMSQNLLASSEQIASLYRTARLRAMGRGSAVLVRFTGTGMQLRERVYGASTVWADGCDNLPWPSCTDDKTAWAAADSRNQLLSSFSNPDMTITAENAAGTALTYLDVCFTPAGRTFARTTATGDFAPLTEVPRLAVNRAGGNDQLLERKILILPNGNSRVVAAP